MSSIVQKAVAINTAAGNSATATFEKPLTAGNAIIVAAVAVDHGAETPGGQFGQNGSSLASISDAQGNFYNAIAGNQGPWVWGWHGSTFGQGDKSLWAGQYMATSGLPGGTNSVTFEFTPISAPENCHVGLIAYEVFDFTGVFALGNDSDLAGGGLPVQLDLTAQWSTDSLGKLVVEYAAVILTTDDLRPLTAGSGFTLDGSATAQIGSAYSTLGFQSYFDFRTGFDLTSTGTFGAAPDEAWSYVCFLNLYDPASAFIVPIDPSGVPFLGSVTEVDSIPDGGTTPFIGTVKTISSAPAGAKNPYLGRVFVGTPGSGQTSNPTLGEVVVIGSAPEGSPNPFLGTVETE